MADPLPTLDAFRDFLAELPGPDLEAAAAAEAREAQLTKPAGALGRLERIATWLAAWQSRHPPQVETSLVAVFAGNHGVVAQGVAPYPQEVTAQMVANFRAGGAAINQICDVVGAGLKVFEMALEDPTGDITREPAMDEADCVAAMLYGREAIAEPVDVLVLGEMGIGNTTVAAALAHGLFGGAAEDWVGPGSGADGEVMKRKVAAVRAAVGRHRTSDPLETLRRLGGREFAAIAGAILAARFERVPVILDGFCVTAAAAVLHAARPGALDHCLAGHLSAEPAHGRLLQYLGLKPVLDLGMRLGEGSGAALALGIVKAAAAAHAGMATFAEAGVSEKE